MSKKYKIFLIAGEASGDLIAGKLMKELKLIADCEFYGVGGDRMIAEGMSSIFPLSDINFMGFSEVVPHLLKIMKRIKETASSIKNIKPDMVITIDCPDFSFRVIKKIQELRKSNLLKTVHYVAPTVWAYRAKRAAGIAKLYDHLLVLLPFEPPYFTKENLETTFIGHHILEETKIDGTDFRNKYNIKIDEPILCLAPGSRKGEVMRILPEFVQAAKRFINKVPQTRIVIPSFPHLTNIITDMTKELGDIVIICDEKNSRKAAISVSSIALTKCGTITNEFALSNIPIISAYKVSKISAFIARRLIKIPHFSLINILAGREVIPEYIQENCEENILFEALYKLHIDKELQKKQIEDCSNELQKLENEEKISPSKKAANTLLKLIIR